MVCRVIFTHAILFVSSFSVFGIVQEQNFVNFCKISHFHILNMNEIWEIRNRKWYLNNLRCFIGSCLFPQYCSFPLILLLERFRDQIFSIFVKLHIFTPWNWLIYLNWAPEVEIKLSKMLHQVMFDTAIIWKYTFWVFKLIQGLQNVKNIAIFPKYHCFNPRIS